MNIGLVLSGGMAKGAYQIGALRALNRFLPLREIKYLSCASVGVLNGYAYITENLDIAEKMWKNICNDQTRIMINKLFKSSMLQQNIAYLCGCEKLLSSAFYCTLLDVNQRAVVYKDLSTVDAHQLPLYLNASIAMPLYNHSVRLDNSSYFDGALIDNIPVYPLLRHELDYIICIYFDDICYKFENSDFDNKMIKITFPCENLLKESVVFSQDSIENMIKSGDETTTAMISQIFFEGYENLEYIYSALQSINNENKNKKLRITGDMIVTNLNKVTQRLMKRKVL